MSFNPLDYEVKGTKLMEDIMAYDATVRPIQQEYMALVSRDANISPEQLQQQIKRYDDAVKKFVKENPNSQALHFVITELSGDDFKTA